MQRFVYVPKVEVFVRCDGDKSGKIVDLTEDIVDGAVTRNVDEMSTASLTLQNKFGRYTGGAKGTGGPNAVTIKPMDRIIIRMSRISEPFLVFSGYVDEVPKFQLYPGTVSLKASCSLKLLANTFFDPGLPFMRSYFKKYGWVYDPTTGALYDDATSGGSNKRFGYLDVAGGIGDVMKHILNDVGNFPLESIDIDALPIGFLKSINDAMNKSLTDDQKDTEQSLARLRKFLGSTSSASPSTTDPSANPAIGNMAAEDVARLALKAGFKGDSAITAVAVAMAESNLKANALNHNSDGSYDIGLWQINTVHSSVTPYTDSYNNNPNPPDPTKVPSNLQPFLKDMFTPLLNAQEAYQVSTAGTIWTPWVTFQQGKHLQYIGTATKAVQTAVLAPDSATLGAVDTTVAATTTDIPRQATEAQQQNQNTVATKVIKIALGEVGVKANGGSRDVGSDILKYQETTGAINAAWCGSFATWCFKQAGINLVGLIPNPASVQNIVDTAKSKGWTTSDPQPGDLICFDGPGIEDHVAIIIARNGNTLSYVGGNQGAGEVSQGAVPIGQTDGRPGVPVYVDIPGSGNAASDAGLGGGADPTAANTQDPSTAGLQGGWAVLQTMNNDSTLSVLLTGERAMQNDISLLAWIAQTCKASGRSFMSKPNGEFFAFFPDYFNYFTKTPYFRISDIELIDFTIYENDTELVTHLFASAPITSGQVGGMGQITTLDRQESKVASIEADGFKAFINMNPGFNPYDFLRRYGARPLPKDYPDIGHPVLLWLAAWMDFTQQWAKTWRADCVTTFLPELFPGTVVEIGQAGGVTMYVQSVTHSFSRSSGFQTDAQLIGLASKTGEPGMVRSGTFNDSRYQATDYIDYSNAPFKDPTITANG